MGICAIGSVIAVKGRLQASIYENDKNKKFYNAEVIAEKVSFISPRIENPTE